MANSKQARKRAKQSLKRRDDNRWQISRMTTAVKKARQLIEEKSIDEAKAAYQSACILLDKLASKHRMHKNKAARLKSRLNKHLKESSV